MNFRDQALEIIKNKSALCINGGGVLGVAICGALFELSELGLPLKNFKTVVGSSVGSIIATGIACGGTIYYIKQTLDEMDLNSFKDNDCFLRSLVQLVKNKGLNETRPIYELATKVLTDLVGNPDITFQELYEKTGVHLIITYLSLNYKRTMYADWVREPDSSVREAIVKSSTIPLFYEAHEEKIDGNKFISCDGGTANNYPINALRKLNIDPNAILGLKLLAPEDFDHIDNGGEGLRLIDHGPPSNVVKYLVDIVTMLRKQAMRIHVHERDWMLSVKIDVGKLSSTDFHITKLEQEWLFSQGKQAVDKYIDELENLLKEDEYPYLSPFEK